MTDGKYDVVLIDPPWQYYGSQDKWGAAAKFYPTMSDAELLDFDIAKWIHDKSVVFCWATCPRLDFACELFKAWGLSYRGVAFVWVKTTKDGKPIGAQGVRPSIIKPTTELVIVGSKCTKGRPLPLSSESVSQVIMAPKREHSRKPDEQYIRIEELYPTATKIEIFARCQRPGWDSWGNEVDTFPGR